MSTSFPQLIEDVFVIRAITYSSCALLVWDYFLTLDDELTYVWGSPPSVVKYLFFGNRYVNLVIQPFIVSQLAGALPLHSTASCLAFSWALALSKLWSYGSVHLLVLLRVRILYGRTLGITIALLVAFILYLCASAALLAYVLHAIQFRSTAYGGTCLGELPPLSWLLWFVGCILEASLFGLTIFTLGRHFSSEFSRISRLVRSLYRHAFIFLLANLLDDVLNIAVWTVFYNSPLYSVANSITITLVNITGQRLAIDMRRLHIQKDVVWSEVSREVEIQLAALDDNPVVPLSSAGLP